MIQEIKPPKQPKRVNIEEADNGYIVSMYTEKGGDKKVVCGCIDEAMEKAKGLFGATTKEAEEKREKEEKSEGSYRER